MGMAQTCSKPTRLLPPLPHAPKASFREQGTDPAPRRWAPALSPARAGAHGGCVGRSQISTGRQRCSWKEAGNSSRHPSEPKPVLLGRRSRVWCSWLSTRGCRWAARSGG